MQIAAKYNSDPILTDAARCHNCSDTLNADFANFSGRPRADLKRLGIASVSLGSVFGLAPLTLGAEVGELLPREQSDWFFIVGIGLVNAFVPQLIYTICSPVIGVS